MKLNNITKSFNGNVVFNKVNFIFNCGIYSLNGPNGSGKSTLFNIINGIIKPDCGEIFIKDIDITTLKPFQIAKLGVVRLFQDVRLYNEITLSDNLKFYISLNSSTDTLNKTFEINMMQYIEKFNLSDKLSILARDISFGERKLFALARVFSVNGDIILLDEPFTGINNSLYGDIIRAIIEKRENKIIIIIEHDNSILKGISDFSLLVENSNISIK